MSIRTEQDLISRPCFYKLKDFERVGPQIQSNGVTNKVKKLVPKLDSNGNVIYKTISIPIKSGGCACKNKKNPPNNSTAGTSEQKVPEMEEVWVDAPSVQQILADNKYVICKLYGTVKRILCENCKTYKAK